jgi:hypothetical protein
MALRTWSFVDRKTVLTCAFVHLLTYSFFKHINQLHSSYYVKNNILHDTIMSYFIEVQDHTVHSLLIHNLM